MVYDDMIYLTAIG